MTEIIRKDEETYIGDGDYVLADGRAWFTVKNHFAVWLRATDEGMVVDIFVNGVDGDEPIASAYAFDADAEDAILAHKHKQ